MGQPVLLRHFGSTALSVADVRLRNSQRSGFPRTQLRTVLAVRFAEHISSLSRGALASMIRDPGRPIPPYLDHTIAIGGGNILGEDFGLTRPG